MAKPRPSDTSKDQSRANIHNQTPFKVKTYPFKKNLDRASSRNFLIKKSSRQKSYKEKHDIGGRRSCVPTYSQDGRLFYDLYARFGPLRTFAAGSETSKEQYTSHSSFDRQLFRNRRCGHSLNSSIKNESNSSKGDIIKPKSLPTKNSSKIPFSNGSKRIASITSSFKNSLIIRKEILIEDSISNSKCSKLPEHYIKKKNLIYDTKKTQSKKQLSEKRLKRELGDDYKEPPHHLGKRVASLNACAIINAFSVDSKPKKKETVSSSKSNKRISNDSLSMVMLVNKSGELNIENTVDTPASISPPILQPYCASVAHPGFAKLGPPNLIASEAASAPSHSPSTPIIKQITTKPKRSVSKKRLTDPPLIQPLNKPLVPSESVSSTIPTAYPLPSVESYHAQKVIPYGPDGSSGYQKITHQIVRINSSRSDLHDQGFSSSCLSHPLIVQPRSSPSIRIPQVPQ
ncbi:unnamed protein product, partial [Protopolystoma xenopodis]